MTETAPPFFEDVPVDIGEVPPESDNARTGPRSTTKLGKLGANKKSRSGVRPLLRADVDKLAGMYGFAAIAIAPINENVANAFAESAEPCAEAWFNMAQQNDAVRRAILWIIEGGAVGALFLAHLPILIAAIPPEKMPPMFQLFFTEVPDDASGVNGYQE